MRNRLQVWLRLWLQKRTAGRSGKLAAYFSSFVFIRELQGWPLVRRLAPEHFVLLAPHTGPRRYFPQENCAVQKSPERPSAVSGGAAPRTPGVFNAQAWTWKKGKEGARIASRYRLESR